MKKLEFKGLRGAIRYSSEDKVYFGKLTNISDLILFEARTTKELFQAFKASVNDYVATLKKLRK